MSTISKVRMMSSVLNERTFFKNHGMSGMSQGWQPMERPRDGLAAVFKKRSSNSIKAALFILMR